MHSNEFSAEQWLGEVALFADPVQALERVVDGPSDPWQRELLTSTDSLTLVLASRGIGKSTTVAVDAYLFAEKFPKTTTLLIAPVARQALELYRAVKSVRNHLPLAVTQERETQIELELPNQSRIVVLPGDADRIRAFRAHRIYLDEAARLPDGGWSAILPMLLESGRLIAITTPAGRQGFFYDAWSEKRGHTIIARSTELQRMEKIVARDKKLMSTSAFRTEHELLFAGSGETFFDWEAIQDAFNDEKALTLQCLN